MGADSKFRSRITLRCEYFLQQEDHFFLYSPQSTTFSLLNTVYILHIYMCLCLYSIVKIRSPEK